MIEGQVGTDQTTALMAAAGRGHLEVVKILVKFRAQVDEYKPDNGLTALKTAAMHGHSDVVRYSPDASLSHPMC